MANTVSEGDLALDKFIAIDSSEDPTAFLGSLEKRNSFSLGSRPATNKNNEQSVCDDRGKALFGSVLRGPAAEWFDSLETTYFFWNEIKTQFIARFTGRKMWYHFQIEAKNFKRQPIENIKRCIHRNKTLVDQWWPTPSDVDADAQTACDNQRTG